MLYDKETVEYLFGIVLANMNLDPSDEQSKIALDSLFIILHKLGISFFSRPAVIGFAKSRNISIKKALQEVKDIRSKLSK